MEDNTQPVTQGTTRVEQKLHTTVVSETAGDPGHGVSHAEPNVLGIDATMWVALAMLVVIGIALWKKVPAVIARSLDSRIALIRGQLEAAKQLRAEAEALKAEYEARAVAAIDDAEAMRANARTEAETILATAQAEATLLIERRGAMAEDKIAAAERAAIAEVRNTAAGAAARAAATLIATNHDAASDRTLIDQTISRLN